jgi:carbonic anhydrase/acetyltransferase-like protein (isoleucine patch superfamily)
MGAIVLTRARIGARSTVAAGSVVLEDFEVPDDMLAAGNPATLKKQLDGRTASAFQNPSAPSEIANGLDSVRALQSRALALTFRKSGLPRLPGRRARSSTTA